MNSILLVGRTNAGKSSLFNALVSKTISVVDQKENLTTDIVKFSCDDFTIYDSPGFENLAEFEHFLTRVRDFDTVCMVCDPTDYSPELCRSIIRYFKDKKCILVINKSDLVEDLSRFAFHGIETFHISVLKKVNMDKLRKRLGIPKEMNQIHRASERNSKESGNHKVQYPELNRSWSIFGRSNVGKSSIANLLLDFDRFTVQNEVGTTKEINPETHTGLNIDLVDTPGYRKNNQMESLDRASQYRLENYIEKHQGGFALFVIDASLGFLRTDRVIINKILDKFILLFVINKTDLVEEHKLKDIESEVKRIYPHIDYVLMSTVTKQGKDKLLNQIKKMKETQKLKISTPILNKWLHNQHRHPIKYITQKNFNHFILFSKRELNSTQIKYFENSMCDRFNIRGTRVKFDVVVS